MAAHAVYGTARCIGTYHSFHRLPGPLGKDHIDMLKQLVPIMHEVLCRVIGDLKPAGEADLLFTTLSARERTVAHLAGQGKTNNEIADILRIGEVTIKTHVTKIYHKLGVGNRAQLIRMTLEYEARREMDYGLKVL